MNCQNTHNAQISWQEEVIYVPQKQKESFCFEQSKD